MPETPAIDAEDAAVDTVGQKYVNIDRPKTSDSNWIFQRRFRDSSVRQYENAGAFVMESAARVAVLERLVEGPAAPSEIAAERSVDADSAGNAAEALRDRELTELLVADDERVYGLTAKGEQALVLLRNGGQGVGLRSGAAGTSRGRSPHAR